MEFAVSRKGTAVVGLWFALAGGVLTLPFWKRFLPAALTAFLLWLALCFLLVLRLSSCRVRLGAHHLTVRRGLLLLTVRRLPLRCVTGCHLFVTPLQRRTGTCLLLLSASGCTTLLPGVPAEQAERLCALLMQGGAVL